MVAKADVGEMRERGADNGSQQSGGGGVTWAGERWRGDGRDGCFYLMATQLATMPSHALPP